MKRTFHQISDPTDGVDQTADESLSLTQMSTSDLLALQQRLHTEFQQRQQAEYALQATEAKLNDILNSADVVIASFRLFPDRSWRYDYYSPACEIVYGYSSDELVSNPHLWESRVLPEDWQAVVVPAFAAATQGRSSRVEYRFRHRDGSLRWLDETLTSRPDETANGWVVTIVATDITARKHAEEIQRQQAAQERLLAEITQRIRQSLNLSEILDTTVAEVRQFLQVDRALIYRFQDNLNGHVVVESVIPPWTATLGKQIRDTCFTSQVLQRYRQGEIRAIKSVQAEGYPDCYLELLGTHQVQASLVVPIVRGDALWGLLILHQCDACRQWQVGETDFLQRLAAQLGIAIQQAELYERIQQLNADLEHQVRARTTQLEMAYSFEATLKRITDKVRESLDENQIMQTAVRELAIALGVSSCNAALYDLEQGTSDVRYEYTTLACSYEGRTIRMESFPEIYEILLQGQDVQFCSLIPNADRGMVAMLAFPILDDQGVLGDLWLTSHSHHVFQEQDIRLVQQVRNQCAIALRQSRLYQAAQAQVTELERLNALKDDFLSTVSHELRTPMSSIKMAIQMLEVILFKDIPGDPKLLQDLETDLVLPPASLQRMARYFRILKDESQREISLINDLLDLSRLDAGTETITISPISLDSWLPHIIQGFVARCQNQRQQLITNLDSDLPPLMSDMASLERILAELLNNACKYTPAGETIAISAQVWEPTHQPVFEVRVSNSGVEIPPSECERVFDKFYRIPNNDPWKHGGTGLGLALVKKLVERLDGTIQIECENNQTCFALRFPVEAMPVKTA